MKFTLGILCFFIIIASQAKQPITPNPLTTIHVSKKFTFQEGYKNVTVEVQYKITPIKTKNSMVTYLYSNIQIQPVEINNTKVVMPILTGPLHSDQHSEFQLTITTKKVTLNVQLVALLNILRPHKDSFKSKIIYNINNIASAHNQVRDYDLLKASGNLAFLDTVEKTLSLNLASRLGYEIQDLDTSRLPRKCQWLFN